MVDIKVTVDGIKARRGENMTEGPGWKLVATKGTKRMFSGRLLKVVNSGKMRIAIFSVPK